MMDDSTSVYQEALKKDTNNMWPAKKGSEGKNVKMDFSMIWYSCVVCGTPQDSKYRVM